MSELPLLLEKSVNLFVALNELIAVLVVSLINHWIILVWLAFWLFIVRWPDVRAQLERGAWAAAVLLYVLVSLVWGVSTQPSMLPSLAGLEPIWASVLEKFFLSFIWALVALCCGHLQDHWRLTPPPVEIPLPPEGEVAANHNAHGQDH